MARSFNDVAIDLMTNILRENESIDVLPGQVVRDVFINGMAQEFSNNYNVVDTVATAQSISNAAFMSVQDLNNLVGNYGITRKTATQSTGQVTFYTNTLPSQDVFIPAGTRLGTGLGSSNQQITFQTLGNLNLFISAESSYFNIKTGNWELTANVSADQAGEVGNVGPFAISTVMDANLPMRVTNNNPTTGGFDQESNVDLAVRTINTFLGTGKGTKGGYLGLVTSQSYILDAIMQGPGDPMMIRDNGFGGKVDIWVIPTQALITQLTPANTPSLEIPDWQDSQEVLSNYTFPFPQRPVDPSQAITVTATLAPSGNLTNILLFESRTPAPSDVTYVNPSGLRYHYSVQLDNSLNYGGSTRADDNIIWNATEMDYLKNLFSGNTMSVDISYSTNTSISSAQSIIDSDENKIIAADALVKDAVEVILDIVSSVVLEPSFKTTPEAQTQTIGNIITAIVDSINTNKLGQTFQESDLIQTIHNVPGVDNVIISSIVITRRYSPFFNIRQQQVTDTTVNPNEYFVAGNINIQSVAG
jgi:uncharacterized phage protein gp47/JayE